MSAVAKIQELKQFTTRGGWGKPLKGCVCGCKDTRIKAIHNKEYDGDTIDFVVSAVAKIQELKQFTTAKQFFEFAASCVCGCKDTRIKAIHNSPYAHSRVCNVVSAVAKIQELKQFTTCFAALQHGLRLCLRLQRYKN